MRPVEGKPLTALAVKRYADDASAPASLHDGGGPYLRKHSAELHWTLRLTDPATGADQWHRLFPDVPHGSYPHKGLADARTVARRLWSTRSAGVDPRAERRRQIRLREEAEAQERLAAERNVSPSAPCSNDGPRPSCIRPCLLMGLGVDHLEHRCTRRRTDRCGLVCHRARRFEAAAHRRCQRRQARPRRLASPHCLDHEIESRVRRTDITRSSRRRPGRGLRLDFLRAVWAGDLACTAAQLRAAVAALPYVHQRLGEGGKKDQTQRAAAKVASRFVPVSPPRLVVSNGPRDPRQVAPPVP